MAIQTPLAFLRDDGEILRERRLDVRMQLLEAGRKRARQAARR